MHQSVGRVVGKCEPILEVYNKWVEDPDLS